MMPLRSVVLTVLGFYVLVSVFVVRWAIKSIIEGKSGLDRAQTDMLRQCLWHPTCRLVMCGVMGVIWPFILAGRALEWVSYAFFLLLNGLAMLYRIIRLKLTGRTGVPELDRAICMFKELEDNANKLQGETGQSLGAVADYDISGLLMTGQQFQVGFKNEDREGFAVCPDCKSVFWFDIVTPGQVVCPYCFQVWGSVFGQDAGGGVCPRDGFPDDRAFTPEFMEALKVAHEGSSAEREGTDHE